jgi:23S rRNA (adenine2503-C2)-methyltransferase
MWKNIKKIDSSNQNVCKFVFTANDAVAESVLYKYPTYEDRTVICCSTQSGCPVGCRFCGAGDYFVRSLTSEEIISQPEFLLKETGVPASSIKKLQIMFMSMGEPMLNYLALAEACIYLNSIYPNAKLLISTSAPVAFNSFISLRGLSKAIKEIGLQFSVHESTDEARKKLIPTSTMTLEEIAFEGEMWAKETGRKPFFNYCVHERNNTTEDLNRLKNLFKPEIWEATLSVVCERDEHLYQLSERQKTLAENFSYQLLEAGYSTRVFNPAGQDTANGCGQLWETQKWIQENQNLAKPSKGSRLSKVHMPI